MNYEGETVYGPALGLRFREQVLAHGRARYERDGWDLIVGLSVSELAEVIGGAETLDEALALASVRAGELDRARRARAVG
jgi:hypothetical protein